MEKLRIGISACLLGESVRFDGGHKHHRWLTGTFGEFVEWVPFCPEVESGFPIPRPAMHLEEGGRLVISKSGEDVTSAVEAYIPGKLEALSKESLHGVIFKSKSPSCGYGTAKIFPKNRGVPSKGNGLFADALSKQFQHLPIEDDGRLNDPDIRENFIERIYVHARFLNLLKKPSAHELINFHRDHKYLLLSHQQRGYRALGALVGNLSASNLNSTLLQYFDLLMETLSIKATRANHANTLTHIMGYFKQNITAEEKQEIKNLIESYQKGLIPLIVPITLMKHFVLKYNEPYLKTQFYLSPHPHELMLRNHV